MNDEQRNVTLHHLFDEAAHSAPVEEVAWEDLKTRIVRKAKPALARLRPVHWWEHAARWARPAIPAAAAAGLALTLIMLDPGASSDPLPVIDSGLRVETELMRGSLTEAEALMIEASEDESDVMLQAVLTFGNYQ